ncbi:MAG: HRDC domain-containing protein [Planctomycetia bacterium]|nr:HRDC domain-containing protein [Planctomycetia bacterium]
MTSVERIIDRQDALAHAVDHLSQAAVIGFDTEFVGEQSFHPELCLIQVSTADRLMLIDPQACDKLDDFWELMTSGKVEVVVHAGREEIRQCIRATGLPPQKCYDVQIAAGLLGLGYPLGHAALVNQLLGANLSKSETLTDWRTRPLTPQQVRYAYDDVRFLIPLYQRTRGKLEKLNRLDWAKEEFQRLTVIAADEAPNNLERWRKVKGTSSLHPRQLAVLREMFAWRQERAEALNRPARTLIRDEIMVDLIRRDPKTVTDLQGMRGLGVARRDLEGLLAAMERGRKTPNDQWPVSPPKETEPPQLSVLVEFLQVVLGQLSLQMKLSSSLICTVSDLRNIIKRAMGEKTGNTLLNEGWRLAHVRPFLDAVLHGQYAMRVGKLQTSSPLEFTGPELPLHLAQPAEKVQPSS